MDKKTLVKAIAEKTGLPQKQVKAVIDAFTEVVMETLKKKEEVKLTGFGTFTVAERKERTYINPQTKEPIKVPKRIVPVFRVGSKLKAAVMEEAKKTKKKKPCKKKKKK
ncbi:hypothetical protein GM182_06565 [bacterium 3DAC]|jgi:DNA-binding protein HU-beta|nr:HU family DNA-binding protein [Dictyoglomota bacterium]UZN23515.1 hypothetical protein GM182_06565 [bacterium 3DAC]